MNPIIEYLTGLNVLTDQVVATDLLLSAKTGVRTYAMAVTETISPEIRATLTQQLEQNINVFEQVSNYMVEQGWYQPWNVDAQLEMDLTQANTALNLP